MNPQRWVWTTTGMEPYRPHPLMPDVGGVFVRAEEHEGETTIALRTCNQLWDDKLAAREARLVELENNLKCYGDMPEALLLTEADRDRWRTWAISVKDSIDRLLDSSQEKKP